MKVWDCCQFTFLFVGVMVGSRVFAADEPFRDASQPIDVRVNDLLARVSLEDKIDQLSQKSVDTLAVVDGKVDQGALDALFHRRSTGTLCVKLGDDVVANAIRLAACQRYLREHSRFAIPALTLNEALHGVLSQGTTIYPQFLALGCTWNPTLAEEMGAQIAVEASAAGLVQVLAPMIEVVRDPRWGRVEECIGESPYLVSRMTVAYTLGIQGNLSGGHALAPNKILATLKTLAGYSVPVNGMNIAPAQLGERELRSVFFPPAEAVIRETGALCVMPSYNEVDGVPSHANHWLLEDVLRGEMGFKGYTYSDWGGVRFNTTLHRIAKDKAEAAALAIQAGVDLEAPAPECYASLASLVKEGRITEADIDRAAGRVLRTKFVAGLFDGRPDGDLSHLREIVHSADHIALSRRIAEESIVLLKNANDILPLDPNRLQSVAVIGPNADQVQFGDYSWSKSNRDGVTVLQALRDRLGPAVKTNYAKGCDLVGLQRNGFETAVKAARESQVAVVVLGDTSMILSGVGWEDPTLPARGTVGEGYDVTDLVPPGVQPDLLRAVLGTGTPVVLVFLNGRPYGVPWIKEQVPCIVEAFYGGEQQGNAIADVLVGRVNPSGRLTMSVPQSAGQIPVTHDYKPSGRGYYHRPGTPEKPGRDYVFSSPDPLWAFGFGLCYTRFEYTDLKVDKPVVTTHEPVKISFTLRNAGSRAGLEVAQVYIRDEISSVTTPVMKLAGFEKVALQPGESQTVHLQINPSELALWNVAMKRVVEPGDFSVMVGASAADIRLREKFEVVTPKHD
jgi:beta-glucosidase